VDYSYSGINEATISEAPDSFGNALNRFLQRLQCADTRNGDIYLGKTDVADAFMLVWISLATIPSLGTILPTYANEEPLIAFPILLPMGWVDSPNYLCTVTETATNLANAHFDANALAVSPHHLATLVDSWPPPLEPCTIPTPSAPSSIPPPPSTHSQGPLQRKLNYIDVYMDDFLHATQLSVHDRAQARDTLFECIDNVLRSLSPDNNPHRKEPISTKKLLKGDAAWSTKKTILGWLMDTSCHTIELPPHRLEQLNTLLSQFPHHQRRTSHRKWQQLLDELRSMVLAIPGGCGLFSQLQTVLTTVEMPHPSDRLRLSTAIHDQLNDIHWISSNLGTRPTWWAEAVDSSPTFLGMVDMCGMGMGGTWISPNPNPILF
jgi:hypothetical protein